MQGFSFFKVQFSPLFFFGRLSSLRPPPFPSLPLSSLAHIFVRLFLILLLFLRCYLSCKLSPFSGSSPLDTCEFHLQCKLLGVVATLLAGMKGAGNNEGFVKFVQLVSWQTCWIAFGTPVGTPLGTPAWLQQCTLMQVPQHWIFRA